MEGSQEGEEGCLSFPGLYGEVSRAVTIHVRYQDLELRPREMTLDGWVARIFQHELDHLNGEVFVDKMLPASREKIESGLEELQRRYAEASA